MPGGLGGQEEQVLPLAAGAQLLAEPGPDGPFQHLTGLFLQRIKKFSAKGGEPLAVPKAEAVGLPGGEGVGPAVAAARLLHGVPVAQADVPAALVPLEEEEVPQVPAASDQAEGDLGLKAAADPYAVHLHRPNLGEGQSGLGGHLHREVVVIAAVDGAGLKGGEAGGGGDHIIGHRAGGHIPEEHLHRGEALHIHGDDAVLHAAGPEFVLVQDGADHLLQGGDVQAALLDHFPDEGPVDGQAAVGFIFRGGDALHDLGVIHIPPEVPGGVELALGHEGAVEGAYRGTGDDLIIQVQFPEGLPDADLVGAFGAAATQDDGTDGMRIGHRRTPPNKLRRERGPSPALRA